MNNKLIIATIIILGSISYADYTAKIYVDGVQFKDTENTPVVPTPSTNCIYDINTANVGATNIGDTNNSFGVGIGDSIIMYNGLLIGRDTATENFPAGLTFGNYVHEEDYVGFYEFYEICADDFSIYPDLNNPPPSSYTYNDFNIPSGAISTTVGGDGYDIYGFVHYDATRHPTLTSIGSPISTDNGNRIMLEIFEHNSGFNSPLLFVYIVKDNETINEQLSDSGNILSWWDQYDRIILSNNDESFKIEINISNNSTNANWIRDGKAISVAEFNQIASNPNIITQIRFREK